VRGDTERGMGESGC